MIFRQGTWVRFVSCSLLGLAAATPALAQSSLWLEHAPTEIAVDALHPEYDSGPDVNAASAGYVFSARMGLANGASIFVEVPFAYVSAGGVPGDRSEGSIGNLTAGLRLPYSDHTTFEFGGRLPTADDGLANAYAAFASLEWIEAFAPEEVSVFGLADMTLAETSILELVGKVGGTLGTGVGRGGGGGCVSALYGAQAWVAPGAARVGVGVTGRAFFGGYGFDPDRSTWHQLGAHADLDLGAFRPGVDLRVPIDDRFDVTTFGVSLQYRP